MKALLSVQAAMRYISVLVIIFVECFFCSCGTTDFDHYLTYNADRSFPFAVSNSTRDTTITLLPVIDETMEYAHQHIDSTSLGTSIATRILLISNDNTHSIQNLTAAVAIVNSDTIGVLRSVPVSADSVSLTPTNFDITHDIKSGNAKVSIILKSNGALPTSETLYITVVHTALLK